LFEQNVRAERTQNEGPEIFNRDEIMKLTVFDFDINPWKIFEKPCLGGS